MYVAKKFQVISIILVLLFVLIGCYVVSIIFWDTHSYESVIAHSYNIPKVIENKEYNGDYLGSLINLKSIKISLVAVVVAAIGCIFTFIAFLMQKEANDIHRNDIAAEHLVENHLKLIDIYRDVVKQIDINGMLSGQAAFHFLFYELKSLYVHLLDSYPFFQAAQYRDAAVYASMKIFMSGCTDGDNSKLIVALEKHLGSDLPEHVEWESLMCGLERLNVDFVTKREPPKCFIFAKYKDPNLFPQLPPLYKGQLQRLSPYFNLIELFLKLSSKSASINRSDAEVVDLYKELFTKQLSIHEAAMLNMYFRFKNFESGCTMFSNEAIRQMTQQINQFPATFDMDHEDFCKPSY